MGKDFNEEVSKGKGVKCAEEEESNDAMGTGMKLKKIFYLLYFNSNYCCNYFITTC